MWWQYVSRRWSGSYSAAGRPAAAAGDPRALARLVQSVPNMVSKNALVLGRIDDDAIVGRSQNDRGKFRGLRRMPWSSGGEVSLLESCGQVRDDALLRCRF